MDVHFLLRTPSSAVRRAGRSVNAPANGRRERVGQDIRRSLKAPARSPQRPVRVSFVKFIEERGHYQRLLMRYVRDAPSRYFLILRNIAISVRMA